MYTYEVMIIRFMHVCSNSNFDLFGMEQNALHNKGKIKVMTMRPVFSEASAIKILKLKTC